MDRFRFRVVLLPMVGAVILNGLVAWGCVLWSPYTSHTEPSDKTPDGGFPPTIPGPYGEQGYWFSGTGVGVWEAYPMGARGAEGQFSYFHYRHTPAYYRGGWPMHSFQSTVTSRDDGKGWDLPPAEILQRGMQTNWLPSWLHARSDRRLPIVPVWHGLVVNTLLYFGVLLGVRLACIRIPEEGARQGS